MLSSLVISFAQPEGGAGGGLVGTLIMVAAFFAIFYFLLIRPQRQQQKKHDEMVKALKRGDEVVTIGGVIGQIIHVKDDRLTVKTADETRLLIERDKVARKIGAEAEARE